MVTCPTVLCYHGYFSYSVVFLWLLVLTGLCFQGFVDAFFIMAKRKFSIRDRVALMHQMLDYCANNHVGQEEKKSDRLPRINQEQRLDNLKRIYGSNATVGRRRRGPDVYYTYRDVRDKN